MSKTVKIAAITDVRAGTRNGVSVTEIGLLTSAGATMRLTLTDSELADFEMQVAALRKPRTPRKADLQ